MNDDLPALFRAAHAAIGDDIVPPEWPLSDLTSAVFENHGDISFSESTINSGIVHTQIWLAANATCGEIDLSRSTVGTIHRGEYQSEPHDSTPASIYAALLRLATRVAQEKTNG